MASLLELTDAAVAEMDFESICRLCLARDGVMTSIYGDSRRSALRGRILSLASVQILPDDGLPGLICHSCRDKVERSIKFREQIENSYRLLCRCIGVEPCLATASSLLRSKSRQKNQTQRTPSKTNKIQEETDDLSNLFKDHYLEAENTDLLVNPTDGFVNIDHVSYASVRCDDDRSFKRDTCNAIIPSEVSKDMEMPSSQEVNGLMSDLAFCNMKTINDLNDEKIYNVEFTDIRNAENGSELQELFQCLDHVDGSGDSGFDDIAKYLKSSHAADVNKTKIKVETNEHSITNDLLKAETDDDAVFQKDEESQDNTVRDSLFIISENQVLQEGCDTIDGSMENGNDPEAGKYILRELLQGRVDEKTSEETLKTTRDILQATHLFEELHVESREIYTETNIQDEIVPRITEIFTTFLQQSCSSDDLQNGCKTEQELLTLKKYMCHLCLTEFGECDFDLLSKHSRSHFSSSSIQRSASLQNRPPFNCEVCSDNFTQRQEFVIHQREHTGIKPFVCNTCHRAFSSSVKLSEHCARHVNDSSAGFACAMCDKVFSKNQELQYHTRTHFNNTPLICKVCDKPFSNSITLRMHQRRHTEGTKHCCELCGKSFFNKTELMRHEQLHSGIRRFPCHLCEKAFCSNAERRRHLLYHFKTKKFKCVECDKAFYESGHLNIHMRIHTNFKPHICDVCGKGFPTKIKLSRHLKMHSKPSNNDAKFTRGRSSSKTKVIPKFTKLNPTKLDDVSQILSIPSVKTANDGQSGSGANPLTLELLAGREDDDEESYIIIEEGDDSNESPDFSGISGVQMFTDDNGEVFYVLNNDNLETLGNDDLIGSESII